MIQPGSKPKVGIDLGALLLHGRAPGTVKMVIQQTEALLKTPVPWTWCLAVPERVEIPFDVPEEVEVHRLPGHKVSVFSILTVGRLWDQLNCAAAFAPGTIAPRCQTPILSTYFDSNIFEHGWTWIASGQTKAFVMNRVLAWHTFRVSRRILMNSNYCREQIIKYKPAYKNKIFVNHCGTTPPQPPPNDTPEWARPLAGQPFYLNVGAFSENKGQGMLVKAWKILQERHTNLPHLVLMGPCPAKYMDRILGPRLKQLPRQNEVILTGHVPNTDWSWAYGHAAGYIQPSIAEGFSSFSVFEAMHSGIPVVCSNTTSHPEGAADGAHYFNPLDESDMANAIESVWQNKDLRQKLIANGTKHVQQLSWNNNANTVVMHLNEMTGIK